MKRKIMTIVAGAAVGESGCVCLDHCTGDEIEYPILQHPSDNSYYFMHNIDGSYGYPGCIYTENLNSKDFTDNNTVIYRHNVKNDSMPVKQ